MRESTFVGLSSEDEEDDDGEDGDRGFEVLPRGESYYLFFYFEDEVLFLPHLQIIYWEDIAELSSIFTMGN